MRLAQGILVAVLLIVPRTSLAQTAARAPDESRIFVDINVSGAANSMAHSREFRSLFVTFGEIGSTRAIYPKPSRENPLRLIDLGGGVMLTRSLGMGVSYSRSSFDSVVNLAATIPHPTFLNAPATDTGVTAEALKRRESATHVFVAFVPVRTRRVQVRILGGPSFFSYQGDLVQDVLFAQAFDPLTPQNTISIDGVTSLEARGRTIGFHAGADVTYFLTKAFGVGGGVRLSYGAVTVDEEPMSGLSQQIRVGSTLVFLGIRARFGG